jgi:hypothetical protein
MVAYLNNTEVFRFNMPATGVPVFTTLASAALAEPIVHITNVVAAGLVNGDNVLAVEVHQSAADSSDVVFGMSVTLFQPSPIVITSQPQSQTIAVGQPLSLSVGVTGSNPRFQWYRNGASVGGATSNSFNIASATTNAAGNYTVVITNALSSVTSSVAVVTITSDVTGPQLLSAIVQDTPTNSIQVNFDERFLPATATNLANYKITRCDGAVVAITNIQVLTTNVVLRVGSANFVFGGDYILTVNGVADTKTNYISPTNNQIGISFFQEIMPMSQSWTFYYDSILSGTFPPATWVTNNYDESVLGWGGPSPAAFYFGNIAGNCVRNTTLGNGPITYYFRTHFTAPTNSGRADLNIRSTADSGQVYYLNGVEIARNCMPATAITPTTPGQACALNCAVPASRVVTVNNLRTGDNVLAVEVHQTGTADDNFYFAAGLRVALGATVARTHINYAVTNNNLRLSWTTGPHVLQMAPEATGPWAIAGSNLTGFTNPITGPRKFFRLREKCD